MRTNFLTRVHITFLTLSVLSANWIGLIASLRQFSFSFFFFSSLLNSQGSLTECQEFSLVVGMDINGLTSDLVTCPCVSASKPFYHGTLQCLLPTDGRKQTSPGCDSGFGHGNFLSRRM